MCSGTDDHRREKTGWGKLGEPSNLVPEGGTDPQAAY